MKKILLSLLAIGLLAVPMIGLAQTSVTAPVLGVMNTLEKIINWLFTILLVGAVIFIIIAAFMFVTAQGDAAKVETARNYIMYALIGVAVAFLARGLIALVSLIING